MKHQNVDEDVNSNRLTTNEQLLIINGLSKCFGEKLLWHDVSFVLRAGETLSVRGASGSGKSTLLFAIGGLEMVQSGTIRFCGHRVDYNNRVFVDGIGYVFQHYHLIEELTVKENLLLPFSIKFGHGKQPDVLNEVLDLLELNKLLERLPMALSGGERQRVSLARTVLAKPKLLLADEPTGSLDEEAGARVMMLLFQLCQRFRMSLILVTHNPSFAAQTDRKMILKNRRLYEESI
jgi:ABC-type lipoprotein export system ATPase subunit